MTAAQKIERLILARDNACKQYAKDHVLSLDTMRVMLCEISVDKQPGLFARLNHWVRGLISK